eukprot:CAMPEP_0172493542 /NCGR_PEP_ID=MMETSP1066-20121228/24983_1 /TAXON_ID=671091 /ORGANISM="Coscinodiscus wailesii, Strain CCMP2513" /LENGTH=71 /DNA_ID=CAMNT_0013263753 /DNA_START=330 /DNA_END=545 /DNA_ORIENTATION=-
MHIVSAQSQTSPVPLSAPSCVLRHSSPVLRERVPIDIEGGALYELWRVFKCAFDVAASWVDGAKFLSGQFD